MKQNTRFFTHTSIITALFILGNAVITLPTKNAGIYTFSGYLTAVGVGYLILFLLLPFSKRLFCENSAAESSKFKKTALCFLYFLTAVFALWCAADAFRDFIKFVKDIILGETPMFFTVIIFAAAVVFFATRRQEDILKFFLVAFWFILAVILFFFIATAFKFNLRNIFIFQFPDLKQLVKQTRPYLMNPIIATLLMPVYNVFVFQKSRTGAMLTGFSAGVVLLGLCVIGSVLLFGAPLAGELDYPYSSAISTVSIGRLFSRLDGFSYFLYFACALAKITVSLFVMETALKRTHKMSKKIRH